MQAELEALCDALEGMDDDSKVDALNEIRRRLHEISPMRGEPCELVLWVPAQQVVANDYNPNVVAAPEMKLLTRSIEADGYTQPIVVCENDAGLEVVDGFHRHRVGKEVAEISARVRGRLPVTLINSGRSERPDRQASTIRHNRARGLHTVEGMQEIVRELVQRNWTDAKIGKELGMDPDEVLRLKQITGLAALFADREFSEAWEPDDSRGGFSRDEMECIRGA